MATTIDYLLLLHVVFRPDVALDKKVAALGGKYQHIRHLVEETRFVWHDDYLNRLEMEELFGGSAEKGPSASSPASERNRPPPSRLTLRSNQCATWLAARPACTIPCAGGPFFHKKRSANAELFRGWVFANLSKPTSNCDAVICI
jgi:hypothetical protein